MNRNRNGIVNRNSNKKSGPRRRTITRHYGPKGLFICPISILIDYG